MLLLKESRSEVLNWLQPTKLDQSGPATNCPNLLVPEFPKFFTLQRLDKVKESSRKDFIIQQKTEDLNTEDWDRRWGEAGRRADGDYQRRWSKVLMDAVDKVEG